MKNVKIITIILAIILVTLVAFGGIYIKTQNRMENVVKDYQFGRELGGQRVIELKVVAEGDSKPKAEELTAENYETVKNTIEKRIQNVRKNYPTLLGPIDYTIALNKENGIIRIEMPENNSTDLYAYFLTADSKVEIKDKDTKTKLLNDSMVEKSNYTYGIATHNHETGDSYQVYLEVYLNNEGQAKIEEIKNNYAILEKDVKQIEEAQETAKKEENATEETKETKKIAVLTVAGAEYKIDKIEKDKITVKIGTETTSQSTINSNINAATELSLLINSGKYPITYEITENQYIYSDIGKEEMLYFGIAIAIIMLIVFVIFTIKYKTKGLLASISFIGIISILSLVLRYTNIKISIEGLGAIILTLIINIRINLLILKGERDIDYKELIMKAIPLVIIILVFCFASWQNLSDFGLIMFWGLTLITIYNMTVTKTLLKIKESK